MLLLPRHSIDHQWKCFCGVTNKIIWLGRQTICQLVVVDTILWTREWVEHKNSVFGQAARSSNKPKSRDTTHRAVLYVGIPNQKKWYYGHKYWVGQYIQWMLPLDAPKENDSTTSDMFYWSHPTLSTWHLWLVTCNSINYCCNTGMLTWSWISSVLDSLI